MVVRFDRDTGDLVGETFSLNREDRTAVLTLGLVSITENDELLHDGAAMMSVMARNLGAQKNMSLEVVNHLASNNADFNYCMASLSMALLVQLRHPIPLCLLDWARHFRDGMTPAEVERLHALDAAGVQPPDEDVSDV